MTRNHALIVALIAMLIVAGCQQTSIAEQERIKSLETIQAGTPSPTSTPSVTPSASPTVTPTPTVGPTATPTVTPQPTPTPFPPTPTPNPALAGFSLCDQVAGDPASGRFSARLQTISTTVEPALERVVLSLAVPGESAPPHALGRCVRAAAAAEGSPFLLEVDLEGWLHDELFRSSTLTRTIELSGTTALKSAAFRFDQSADAGATLSLGLDAPAPFRLTLEQSPPQLVIEVARSSPIGPSSDMLAIPVQGDPGLSTPLFYLSDGDIWRAGESQPLSQTVEIETSLAVSEQAGKIAFCRAAPGTDLDDALAESYLWVMSLDGSDPVQLQLPADTDGRTCADPVFSPDGTTIAFSVNEGTVNPPRSAIYTVPTGGGQLQRLNAANDEWSRFGPQWLDDERLVYAARSEDGRSTLFVHTGAGREEDIGGRLVVGDRYRALGRPLVAPDGSAIAVEGLRATRPGADLIILDGDGVEQDTIGGSYWVRPVAWSAGGDLFHLSTECASDAVQSYTLRSRASVGGDTILAAGTTVGGFGEFAAAGDALAYVTLERAPAGPRGPLAVEHSSASTLWLWNVGAGPRQALAESQGVIGGLAP